MTLAASLPEQLPPQSLASEQATLGSALISPTAAARMLEMLEAGDFYLHSHQRIYEAIRHLAEAGLSVDTLTVKQQMLRAGLMNPDEALAYLLTLTESVPTAVHVEHYAAIVWDKAEKRRMLDGCNSLIAELHEEALELETLIGRAQALGERAAARGLQKNGLVMMTMRELLAAQFPEPQWVVEGLLHPAVAVLAGPVKARKSFWALCVAIAVATGNPALGMFPVTQSESACVFLEDRFPEVKARSEQLLMVDGRIVTEQIPEGCYIGEKCPRMEDGGERYLDRWLADHPQVRLLVLDPYIRLRGGSKARQSSETSYETDYRDMEAFLRLRDRHGVCILVLTHTRKLAADDWINTLNSSTGLAGAADILMCLQSERGANEATLRATGRSVRDLEMLLRWEDHSGWTAIGDPSKTAQNREQEEVLEVLREAPDGHLKWRHLIDALEELFGVKPDAAKKRIQRLVRRGLLREEAGLYWSPAAPETGRETGNAGNGDSAVPCPRQARSNGSAGTITGDTPPVPALSPVPSQLSMEDSGDRGHRGQVGTPGTGGDRQHAAAPPGTEPPVVAVSGSTASASAAEEPPDPDAALRWRLRTLATERGFPPLDTPDGRLGAGEAFWVTYCRERSHAWLESALRALGEEP